MSNNELFEYLFALRISLQDSYENEFDIIRELKIYLTNINTPSIQINQTLHDFYETYGINVSVETINEASLSSLNLLNNMLILMLTSEDSRHFYHSENEQLSNNNNNNDNNNNDNNNNNNNDNYNNYNNNDNNNNNNNNNDTDNDNDTDNVESEDNIHTINNFANTIFQILSLQNEPTDYFNSDNILSDVVITTDEDDLKTLKTYKLEDNLDINCTICIENMKKNETILELKCSHTFHCDCIKQYLENYNYKCPICREEVGKPKYNI
jgi:hypothetical protein